MTTEIQNLQLEALKKLGFEPWKLLLNKETGRFVQCVSWPYIDDDKPTVLVRTEIGESSTMIKLPTTQFETLISLSMHLNQFIKIIQNGSYSVNLEALNTLKENMVYLQRIGNVLRMCHELFTMVE